MVCHRGEISGTVSSVVGGGGEPFFICRSSNLRRTLPCLISRLRYHEKVITLAVFKFNFLTYIGYHCMLTVFVFGRY